MTTQTRLITYADYLKGPETKERKEIVDGKIVVYSPIMRHQIVSGRIFVPTYLFVENHGLGLVLSAPMDVIVQREPLRVRQPDLMFISNERADIMEIDARVNGGPDLVVEIHSPSNTQTYVENKLADYARIDVRECWLISPLSRTVEVLRLEGGEWRRAYIRGEGERIESAVLPGLELDIADIFQGV